MITLYVNGERLDTPRDAQMAFKWQSAYFSFDDLQISRTQEFTLPRTGRNEHILGFASEVQQNGQMMRQALPAVAIMEGVEVKGTLVIGEVTSQAYRAVLTYGSLDRLAEIKAAGSIGDYLQLSDNIALDGTAVNPVLNLNFARYDNGSGSLTGKRFPSVSVAYLMEQCADYFGVNLSGFNTSGLRILLNTLNADGYQISSNTVTLGTDGLLTGYDANFFTPRTITLDWITIPTLKCTTACKIRFTGANPYVESTIIRPGVQFDYRTFAVAFNGNNDYNTNSHTIDVEIELKEGAHVFFFDTVTYIDEMASGVEPAHPATAQTYTMTISGVGGTTEWGGRYYLQPNLPDVTFIDLIKSVAAIDNSYITYDDATATIKAVSQDNAFDASISIDAQFIAGERMERKVGKWSQDNVITYDEFEGVNVSVKNYTEKHYIIPNTTLEARKVLLQHKFAQGGQTGNTTLQAIHPTVLKVDSTEVKEQNGQNVEVLKAFAKPVLAIGYAYQAGIETLALIKAVNSERLQNICTKSTHYVCKVMMPLYKFMRISERTVFNLKDCDWIVESAEWSKGVARLYLQQLQ